jgi:hypothetical protein
MMNALHGEQAFSGTFVGLPARMLGRRKIEEQWRAALSGKKKGHPLKTRDARSVESPSKACRYCGGFSFGFRCSS